MPDLFHYWLTGTMVNEYTIASTSQMLHAEERTWARAWCKRSAFPDKILGRLVMPGTALGSLCAADVASQAGVAPMPVLATATHDTAAAVAAVPAQARRGPTSAPAPGRSWASRLAAPLTGDKVLECNFTNEGGVGGTIRLLKNIIGLWLVQQCRQAWEKAGRS